MEEAKEKLLQLMATRRRDHAIRAGQCVHEAVEDWLVRETKLRAEGKRWMREGIANVVASEVLAEVLAEVAGPEAGQAFSDAYDVRRFEDWRENVKLAEWKNGEPAGPGPLDAARYAFATAAVREWGGAKMLEVIRTAKEP